MCYSQLELKRQAYLQAMGVESWSLCGRSRARWIENSSKAFKAAEINQQSGSPANLSQSAKSAQITAKASFEQRRDKLLSPAKKLENKAQSQICDRVDTVFSSTTKPPRLRLFVIPLGAGLVVGELPYEGARFSEYHLKLITDLLIAAGHQLDAKLLPSEFVWPVCESLTTPFGEQGAIDAVAGFLDYQFSWQQSSWVMLLGRQAGHYVLRKSFDFDSLRGLKTVAGKLTLISYSVTELMRLPRLKKELWHEVKNWRRSLAELQEC